MPSSSTAGGSTSSPRASCCPGPEPSDEHGRAAGRDLTYHPETEEEAYASRAGYGAEPFELDGWVTSYTAIAAGELAHVSDDVGRLVGRPARSLAQWLDDYPGEWAHLRRA